MERKAFLCLTFVIGLVLSASPVLPCDKAVFGPKEFKVGRFHFLSSFESFKAGKSGEAILEISSTISHANIQTGYVNFNGRFFPLSPALLNKNSTMQVPVYLHNRNYIWVFLYGQRGAVIKLKVKKDKQEQGNQAPSADNQNVELDEDTTASITLTGSDPDGDPLTYQIVSPPSNGILSGTAPALNYTPSADFNGPDSFTFKVNDGKVDSQPATVSITIRPVNDPPKAVASAPATARLGEQVSLEGSKSSDVDKDELTYLWTLNAYPEGLSPVLMNSNEASASFVPYMPGEYTVQLVVSDGKTYSTPATVTVSVDEEKLTADDGAAADRFGSSVSVDLNRAIIGAEGKGSAYIFESQSPWAEKAQLRSGRVGDRFGAAVAVSGDYALVGAMGDNELGIDSGAAYVFKFDGTEWSQPVRIKADDGKAGDLFGASVALSGDLAVIGASGDDTNEPQWVRFFGEEKFLPRADGMAWNSTLQVWENKKTNPQFIFQPNPAQGWANGLHPLGIRVTHTAPQAISLLRIVGVSNDVLGIKSNYLSGQPLSLTRGSDIAMIFAFYPPAITNIEFLVPSTKGGSNAGSAYVFKREGTAWTQQNHLTASDGAEGDAFGISVALGDSTIIVGAKGDDDLGLDSGSAYVFVQKGSAWVEETKLVASDGQAGDQFGSAVAISGDVAVVGAPGADAAYVFSYNGQKWGQEAKLTGDKKGDLFGASVSISGDCVVVGAPGADGAGALYVFKFDGSEWILEGKVAPKEGTSGKEFGRSVSISGDMILSGAPGDNEKGNQAGAAYAYRIDNYLEASLAAQP